MLRKVAVGVVFLALTGCQLTGNDNSTDITSTDFSNMSCDEIEQVFTEYKNNMENLDTGTGLLSSIGIDTGTNEAKATMNTAYVQAKNTAKPVIKAKKCSVNI